MTPPKTQTPPAEPRSFFARADRVLWVVWLLYALQLAVSMVHHEPWRDEAHVWLYAREAGVLHMLADVRLAMHTALWYLMVTPLAKLGLSYGWMQALQFTVIVSAMGLFLFRAPLPRWFRVLTLFSTYFFWEYAVECRVYAIGILLLFLLADQYPNRFRRPVLYGSLLALLFNANAHIMPAAGALTLVYGLELILQRKYRLREWSAPVVAAIGAGLAVWSLGLFSLGVMGSATEPGAMLRSVMRFWVECFFLGVGTPLTLTPAALLVLVVAVAPLLRKPIPLLLFVVQAAGLMLIIALKGGGMRHHGLLQVGLLCWYWVAAYYPDSDWLPKRWTQRWPSTDRLKSTALLMLAFTYLFSLPAGLWIYHYDLTRDYSGTRKMAKELLAHQADQLPIAVHPYQILRAVSMYMPGVQFWDAGIEEYVTYVQLSDPRRKEGDAISYEQALENVNRRFPPTQPIYLLLDQPLDLEEYGFIPLFGVGEKVESDEPCYLYGRAPPEAAARPGA